MFVSCTVSVLLGRGFCDGLIPRPEESYRLCYASECDQVKINNLDTCCEQVGRRGKDYETKQCLTLAVWLLTFSSILHHDRMRSRPIETVKPLKRWSTQRFCFVSKSSKQKAVCSIKNKVQQLYI
jgi:hypothetical protein